MAFLVETSWVHIRWIDDEANSVIRAIRSKDSSDGVMEQIFKTEGYRRLNDRETGMGRPLAKKDFINCITDSKSTADDYSKTLDEWAKLDFNALGNRSAAYLPKNAKLEASVYPLIKPYSNSFVWDVEKNPAIMLYLDPKKSAAEVAMTVTHELHHIGSEMVHRDRGSAESKELNPLCYFFLVGFDRKLLQYS